VRRVLRAAAFTVLLLGTGGARAEGRGASTGGFEVAFRSGVLVPLGDATAVYVDPDGDVYGEELSGLFGVQFPLWLDLGYRFDQVFVGAYGQYAFGLAGRYLCWSPQSSCSTNAIRVGFELQWHPFDWPADQVQVDPWLGVGFGYEWASWRISGTDPRSNTFQGWDFLRLGFGVDFGIADKLALGPFVECSLGQFSKVDFAYAAGGCTYCVNPETGSYDIQRKALHFWLAFGLKLTWRP